MDQIHCRHHLGVDRTLYLARLEDPAISSNEVAKVVNSCSKCLSIDPAPVIWEKGKLDVEQDWWRVATDVTHYNGARYLTMVDCGPSRFAIWRQIRGEDVASIIPEFEQVFRERGPPAEVLMDNGGTFRSQAMRTLLQNWRVRGVYRCAYRPAGNGVVERNHRTIKRMAARSNSNPLDMVFWYNTTPKHGTAGETVPARAVFSYQWRIPVGKCDMETDGTAAHIGQKVFVKPPAARCTTTWPIGTVTGMSGMHSIEVNGVPRHVADLRFLPGDEEEDESEVEVEAEAEETRRSTRQSRPPDCFGNNIYT